MNVNLTAFNNHRGEGWPVIGMVVGDKPGLLRWKVCYLCKCVHLFLDPCWMKKLKNAPVYWCFLLLFSSTFSRHTYCLNHNDRALPPSFLLGALTVPPIEAGFYPPESSQVESGSIKRLRDSAGLVSVEMEKSTRTYKDYRSLIDFMMCW